jgi:hypothetical protein
VASPQPAQPSRQADRLIPALGGLATVVAMAAMVAVLASRRASQTATRGRDNLEWTSGFGTRFGRSL